MLFNRTQPSEKRKRFREGLKSGKLLQFPGAISPLNSLLIEQTGFDGVYISGAVLSNDLALPDIGLTTLTEVAQRGHQIARATQLPSIIDIDTGFGEPMNIARTIQAIESMGIAGCHIEDQINPKRCGHLDGKTVVSSEEMVKRVRSARAAKTDPDFVLIARTDSRSIEGLDKCIDRMKAYVDAGAEMIFPEALQDEKEFEAVRKTVSVPLLANMTEFGKSKLLDTKTLSNLGYNLVIYPVTCQRLAMHAIEEGLKSIKKNGTQEPLLDQMQTRKRLYEVLRYDEYNSFDQNIFNFKL